MKLIIAHLQVLSTVYKKHSEIGISISGYFFIQNLLPPHSFLTQQFHYSIHLRGMLRVMLQNLV